MSEVSGADRKVSTSRSEEDDSDDSGVKDVSKKNDTRNEEDSMTGEDNLNVGDLVWARAPNSPFYPAVVTPDPHFKFHTKIVKSDSGQSGEQSSSAHRQYHLQYLGDDKRVWLHRNYIIPYRGITHYEKLAMEDLSNLNKIYKPKSEASKTAWREAVRIAQDMENITNGDRLHKCEIARIKERGGEKALHKKMEFDKQRKMSEHDRSPEKFKPPSPRKSSDSEDRKKSFHYNRKDELQYKMSKFGDPEKKKRKSEEERKNEPVIPFNVFDSKTTPTFNRSFKIKTIPKAPETPVTPEKSYIKEEHEIVTDNEGVTDGNESENNVEKSKAQEDLGDTQTDTVNQENLCEGALVWAKQRGYPYWPAIIARDPKDGEFVKCPLSESQSSQFKSQRKMHVLFLEYNNQRAWLPSSALAKYRGKQQFEQEAAAAGPSKKKDFSPGKRYQAQFDRAIEFSETLLPLVDEDRLEAVLTKYGWVMVTETENNHVKNSKPKKRKVNSECELEANKSTDSETDSQQSSDKVTSMHRLGSSDRRSSTEAESRLDPAVDTQDGDHDATSSSLPTKKKKRESSIMAAIAMNGDSSSDDNQSDVEQSFSKKSKFSDQSTPKLGTMVENSPAAAPVSLSQSSTPTAKTLSDDEFPRLGDLVWGRMSGFPFWPCFITRSPQGQYKKVGANGKENFHVQFFNWNDESGWVNAVLEFDGLDAFKMVAAKKKSDKSYNPAKGAMHNKWERAARDAEETMDLTRSERLNCFLVTYGSNSAKKVASKPSPSVKGSSKQSTPRAKKVATPAASPSVVASQSNQKPRRTPGPASRTGLKASPSRATGGQLPAGWRIRDRQEGGQTYISPEGREFQDKYAAMRYVASNVSHDSNNGVQYLADNTLPSGWKCQKIHDSIYYFSPRGERFESRDDVASRLELDGAGPEVISRIKRGGRKKKIGPKSALRKIGYEVLSDSEMYSSTSEDEDPEHIMRLPNKMKYRKGGSMDPYMDVDKIFDESNGGMIEMVQLPDIFLNHPTVRVTEADNEMVISDIVSGDFIAKKIIYD